MRVIISLFTVICFVSECGEIECELTIVSNAIPVYANYDEIGRSTSVTCLVKLLGCVRTVDDGSPTLVGVRAPGYLYYPADRAYRRLYSLKLGYGELQTAFTESVSGTNRLRMLLTARLLASLYPYQFTQHLRKEFLSSISAQEKVRMLDASIEAYCCLMSLRPSTPGRGVYEGCSEALFANGQNLFSDKEVRRAMDQCLAHLSSRRKLEISYYAGERSSPKPAENAEALCDDIRKMIAVSCTYYSNDLQKTGGHEL